MKLILMTLFISLSVVSCITIQRQGETHIRERKVECPTGCVITDYKLDKENEDKHSLTK